MSAKTYTVEEVADRLKLRPKKVSGKVRFIGANPTGSGATKDGFTLFAEGNAMDNGGARYNSPEVARMAGIEPGEYAPVLLFLEQHGRGASEAVPGASEPFPWESATVFDYRDESGALLFQVGRVGSGSSKRISQRRPTGSGAWVSNLDGTRRVLYRLGEVLAANSVLIVEGEKAAEAARAALDEVKLLGQFAVTTAPGGAGKWKREFDSALDGKAVYVFPDNDKPGKTCAGELLFSLYSRVGERPSSLRLVELPNLPEKGDIADFLANGGHIGEALELAEAAPDWKAETETPEQSAPRFQVFSFADMERLPRPLWLVRGLLVEHTTSVLSADSGSFKSFFALDMALSVATGRPFHGREVRPGAVVYVAAEGFWTLRDRATAWARFHGVELPRNFHILRVPVDVSNAATAATFIKELSGFDPALVVLDTLSQNALGLNENSNDEMARFMAGMMATARELKAHVQAVHHNSKAGNLRGAGAIHNNADAHISLERPEGGAPNVVFIRCEKQRGAPFDAFALQGQEVALPYSDEYGDPVTSLVFELAGEVPRIQGDGRSDRKATSTARLLEVLNELRGQLEHGQKVSKEQWRDTAIERGLCKRASFYGLAGELEARGAWHWWKGDCRTDTPEDNAESAKREESVKSK